MRRFVVVLGVLLLAGCAATPTSSPSAEAAPKAQAYDIDVSCNNSAGNAFEICDRMQREECDADTMRLDCYFPTFHIKCDKKTVQVIGSTYTCKTHDGQSVRARVTY